MVVDMDQAAINNLLGRGSSDRTVASFRSGDTLRARVTQGIVAGAVGDLLILRSVNQLADQQAEIFAEETKRSERAEYEERMTILGEQRARDHERWLETQRIHQAPPPLVRQPGESQAVFELKQLARQEFLSGKFE